MIMFWLFSCSSMGDPAPQNQVQASSPMAYLALGDSYTIGESVSAEASWPKQLQAALAAEHVELKDPEILARTGWTTDELITGIEEHELQEDYDLVSLQIGVNNQYRGYSTDAYRLEFFQLVKIAVEFAGGDVEKVIVLSIPDWEMTPYAIDQDRLEIAAQIDRFNDIAQEEAERVGVHYINITPLSRMAIQEPDLIAKDGLHPSGIMYAQWVDLALPIAYMILSP